MAVGAQIKWDTHVLRLAIGAIGMALGALYLSVEAGQRVTGLAMVELGDVDGFPVDEIVARLTVRA